MKTKTKIKTKMKTETKMKTKKKMKTKMKIKKEFPFLFSFCFQFSFWFLFLLSKNFYIFVNSTWPRGAIDGQLSLSWPRSAIAFSFANFTRGVAPRNMTPSLILTCRIQ